MNRVHAALLVCAFLAIFATSSARRGLNPCHTARRRGSVRSSCETISLPPSLCRKCRIRAVDVDGFFPDCANIYDLSSASCLSGIADYVDLNPCDTLRAGQLADIDTNPDNRELLDYFVYSVCEECCDCVPFDATAEEYDDRKAAGQSELTQLTRGNCPVHARFDICAIWPQVRDVGRPNETPKVNRPKICPIIETWFQSDLSNGWQTNPNVTMNFQMTRFLKKFNRVAKCRSKKIWQECTALELAQGRI